MRALCEGKATRTGDILCRFAHRYASCSDPICEILRPVQTSSYYTDAIVCLDTTINELITIAWGGENATGARHGTGLLYRQSSVVS